MAHWFEPLSAQIPAAVESKRRRPRPQTHRLDESAVGCASASCSPAGRGKNTQFPLADLFRQSVHSHLAGYEDVNRAERPSQDPTFRLISKEGKDVVFRADAAFAKPELYEAMEKRSVQYAIQIPGNHSLERDIAELLTRTMGRQRMTDQEMITHEEKIKA